MKSIFKDIKSEFATGSTKAGSYSLALIAIVLVIIIAVNLIIGFLPDNYTQLDMTAKQLYSISNQSKVILGSVDQDITIYWVVTSGKEDRYVQKLLNNYASYSSHVSIVQKDPDIYPDFTDAYTDDDIYNNSVVVECGDKSRYISYADMYETSGLSYYSSYSSDTKFAGEKLITSAISYCISDSIPLVYTLEGHGEAELSDSVATALENDNLSTASLSLLSLEAVPDDADCILINAPESDISDSELDMLTDYLDGGGSILVLDGTTKDGSLTNLNKLMEYFSVQVKEGIVLDGDNGSYVYGNPALLLPEIQSSDITNSLIEDKYHVVLPIAKALEQVAEIGGTTITPLLQTSASAYLKTDGYDITSYEQADDEETGTFTLALLAEKTISADATASAVWIGSSYVLEDVYDNYSSGANSDLVINALEYMVGNEDSISIRSKSISNENLTVDSAASSRITLITIAVIPAIVLAAGIAITVKRRQK